jgi:VWFA-related protein
MRRCFIPAFLFALAASILAQQTTTIQTETRVVLVDAIVTAKNGGYIHDLTPKDFRIWEDNKEQKITSFAFESSPEASQPRSLVLFFDESTMEAADQIPAMQSASRFIDAQTGPNRKMAVLSYDGALRVRQNFTDNAGRLKDALPGPSSRVTEAQQQARPEHDSLTGTLSTRVQSMTPARATCSWPCAISGRVWAFCPAARSWSCLPAASPPLLRSDPI